MSQRPGRSSRRGTPRLPWKRGPAAGEIATRAPAILEQLAGEPRGFFSLRQAARLLGVSPQPLRDWTARGYLHRGGPRNGYAREELERFVSWLWDRAEPYDPRRHTRRFWRGRSAPPGRFTKLARAQFPWPKGRLALTPVELARLLGCHPDTLRQAIREGRLRGRRRSAARWEVTRRAWEDAFLRNRVSGR